MNNNNHITPPPELVHQLAESAKGYDIPGSVIKYIATQAARWGADQELETCCKLLELSDSNAREFLYFARRPKPPSLKEQAKQAWLRLMDLYGHDSAEQEADDYDTIRRALEQLDD